MKPQLGIDSEGRVRNSSPLRLSMISGAGLPAEARVDIVGIGVQKAASTWIFRCLIDHPEIRPSRLGGKSRKEINFFNHEYEKGYNWYHRGFEFGTWKAAEFSVLYFHSRNVPERLYLYNPDARLVLCLRDPVDRAWSHHRHEIARGRWSGKRGGFWEALSQNPAYLEIGAYASHLERWLRHFRFEQMHIVEYERIARDPAQVIRDLYEFLEVGSGFRPAMLNERVYTSTVPARPTIDRLKRISSGVLGRFFGPRVLGRLRATKVGARIRDGQRVDLAQVNVPDDADRARLADYFRPEVERLERLLGRSFSSWLR